MIHAIKIETSVSDSNPTVQAARLAALAIKVEASVAGGTSLRGGDALASQRRLATVVAKSIRRGLPDRVVVLHRMTGSRALAVASAMTAIQGTDWYRVWYHACRHDDRRPCEAWELVARSES